MSPDDADGTEDRTDDDGCPGPELSGSGLIATSGAKLQRRRPGGRRREEQKTRRRPQTAEDRRTAGDRTAEDRRTEKTTEWLPGSFLGIRALFQLRVRSCKDAGPEAGDGSSRRENGEDCRTEKT